MNGNQAHSNGRAGLAACTSLNRIGRSTVPEIGEMTAHFGSVEKRRRVYFVISYAESRKPPSSLFHFLGAMHLRSTTAVSHLGQSLPGESLHRSFRGSSDKMNTLSVLQAELPPDFAAPSFAACCGDPAGNRCETRFSHLTRQLHREEMASSNEIGLPILPRFSTHHLNIAHLKGNLTTGDFNTAAKVRKRQPEIAFPQIAKKGVLCGKYHPAKVQKRKRPPGWAIFLFTRDRQGGLPSRCGKLWGAWAA